MNKEQFLKELKKIDEKREELIEYYLCKNSKFTIDTKFKDVDNNNKYIVHDFEYSEKYKEIVYYLEDIDSKTITMILERVLNSYCLNNHWIQINNLEK